MGGGLSVLLVLFFLGRFLKYIFGRDDLKKKDIKWLPSKFYFLKIQKLSYKQLVSKNVNLVFTQGMIDLMDLTCFTR